MSAWREKALECIQISCADSLRAASGELTKFAWLLAKSTPLTAQIVNDSGYMRGLAKNCLLDWKGRQHHSDSAVKLFKASTSLVGSHTAFKLAPSLKETCGDDISYCENVFRDARAAVNIIAACSSIQEYAGEAQQIEVCNVLKKQSTKALPQALQDALNAVSAATLKKATSKAAKRK